MFKYNIRIFLSTLPRTGSNTEVSHYFSLSLLHCDPSRDCLMSEVDRLTMLREARAMPDNGKYRPYVLDVRRTLAKS